MDEVHKNVNNLLQIYGHVIMSVFHGQTRQPFLPIKALMKVFSRLSVLVIYHTHMKLLAECMPVLAAVKCWVTVRHHTP